MQTDKKSTVDFMPIDRNAIIQETVKAFVTQFPGNEKGGDNSQNKSSRHCSHCNRDGHPNETCYQLHGYPPHSTPTASVMDIPTMIVVQRITATATVSHLAPLAHQC
jgi:hypothetical protein